jgi:hypothetical protein
MKIELTDEEKQSKAAYIKGKMDALRVKWERLDASGLYSVEACNCQRQVTALGNRLKELTGEEY